MAFCDTILWQLERFICLVHFYFKKSSTSSRSLLNLLNYSQNFYLCLNFPLQSSFTLFLLYSSCFLSCPASSLLIFVSHPTWKFLLATISPFIPLCSSVVVTQWVVVTHIVNPSHFYVRYVAEKKENEALSKKINHFCCRDSCRFTPSDTLETGMHVF